MLEHGSKKQNHVTTDILYKSTRKKKRNKTKCLTQHFKLISLVQFFLWMTQPLSCHSCLWLYFLHTFKFSLTILSIKDFLYLHFSLHLYCNFFVKTTFLFTCLSLLLYSLLQVSLTALTFTLVHLPKCTRREISERDLGMSPLSSKSFQCCQGEQSLHSLFQETPLT